MVLWRFDIVLLYLTFTSSSKVECITGTLPGDLFESLVPRRTTSLKLFFIPPRSFGRVAPGAMGYAVLPYSLLQTVRHVYSPC